MKKLFKRRLLTVTVFLALVCQCAFAQNAEPEERSNNIITNLASFISQTISDIVTGTANLAGEVVREATEINIFETGYGRKRNHTPLPECASDEARNELIAMHEEYMGVIRQYEEKLGQELLTSETAFENSVSESDSRMVVNEKKKVLEKNADKAYSNFDNKVVALNVTYDARRDKILERALKSEACN